MQQRLVWIDIAKGVGIILVVIGHAGRGISSADIVDQHGILKELDKYIYAFHMQLFFILSGITFGIKPANNISRDLRNRIWRLFYPMVLWTYIFLSMRALAGGYANTTTAWEGVLILPLPPVAHFWFLWALLLNVALFSISRLMILKFIPDTLFWIFCVFLGLLTNFILELPEQTTPIFGNAVSYSISFTTGGLIGSAVNRMPPRAVAIISLAFAFLCLALNDTNFNYLAKMSAGVSISLLVLVACISATHRFEASWIGKMLAFCGASSLSIYVMHTLFSAATRIIISLFSVESVAVHLFLGVVCGVIGPLIAYIVARRFGLLRILGLA